MIENTTLTRKPATAEAPIEIEIIDPDAPQGAAGDAVDEEDGDTGFENNLADDIDEASLGTITSDLLKDVDNDLNARKDWEEMCKEGIKLMGLKIENRTEPWAGACGVFHPMITEATVKFQAETIMETFPAMGPAKTKIIGRATRQKEEAAVRVGDDLNYNLTEVMEEFRPEHERMLWNLSGAGSAFKKVYMDETMGRQTSIFVPAEDVILPYAYTDMNTCFRVTHRMRKTKSEVRKLQESGFWRDFEIGEPPKVQNTVQEKKDKESGISAAYDERFIIYEMVVDLDLAEYIENGCGEETGKELPYIVTILDSTKKILSIRRNWVEDDEKQKRRQHFVHYQYIPGFGAYGFGLFHLIGGFAKNATSLMRQLIDAGTLSNLPGGLKSRGLRIKGDDTPIGPGEFRDVDLGSGGIKDNIMLLPYKEPSQVLAGLLQTCVDEGRRMSATADMKITDMSNQAPVGSTLAILERTLKVLTAVQARVHFSFKQELKLIAAIIRDCTPDEYDYDVEAEQGRSAKKSDYNMVEIIPVSDPNAATLSQRVVQYQAVMQMAQGAPQIYDLPELHKRMLTVLGVQHAEKLIPTKDDMKPVDPVMENQNILLGKPVKAFMEQDHQAHLQVHMAAQQDPMIMAIVGQNPQAQAILAAMEAHKAEHIGFEYRSQMQQILGIPLPTGDDDEEPIPIEREVQLSRMMAQAAPQILAKSKAMAAQQQAQKNAQDPVLQAELVDQQVKKGDLARKEKLDIDTNALKTRELDLREREVAAKERQAGVDPQTTAIEQNGKLQEQEIARKQAEEQSAITVAEAQQRERHADARAAAEIMAKDAQVDTSTEQSQEQMKLNQQRAADEKRRADEQHSNNQTRTDEAHAAKLRQQEAAAKIARAQAAKAPPTKDKK